MPNSDAIEMKNKLMQLEKLLAQLGMSKTELLNVWSEQQHHISFTPSPGDKRKAEKDADLD